MKQLVDAHCKVYRSSWEESLMYTKFGGGNSKLHGGWTTEQGMAAGYNALFAMVRESHRTKEGTQFETWFLKDQKDNQLGRISKDSGDVKAG